MAVVSQLIWVPSSLRLRASCGVQANTFPTPSIDAPRMMAPHDGLPPGVRLIRPLARPLEDGEVWQAETADGMPEAVKLVNNPWTIERLPWLSTTIDRLQANAYPVPHLLWHAPLREGWFGMVLEWGPGTPVR